MICCVSFAPIVRCFFQCLFCSLRCCFSCCCHVLLFVAVCCVLFAVVCYESSLLFVVGGSLSVVVWCV